MNAEEMAAKMARESISKTESEHQIVLREMEAHSRMMADPSGVHQEYLDALEALERGATGSGPKRRVYVAEKARIDVLNRHRADLGLPPESYPWEGE